MSFLRLVFFVLLSFILCSCESQHRAEMLLGETMGTSYTIKFIPDSAKLDKETLQKDIDSRLAAINSIMSTYDAQSELSLFNSNQSTGKCIPISEELRFTIKHALEISNLTQGSFDITIGPLVNAWGFGPGAFPVSIPEENELTTLRNNFVGYEKIQLGEPPCLSKDDANVYIDLSAIAKGYAVDEIAKLLETQGIDDFMIEIGGELKASGLNITQVPWQIGIEKPIGEQRSVQRIIALQNYGLATSGDYRNYFEKDGQRYSHLIDANTGKPIQHKTVSVTVLHKSTMLADALATAFIIKGHEEGLKIAQQENLAVLFIVKKEEEFLEIETDLFNNLTKQ